MNEIDAIDAAASKVVRVAKVLHGIFAVLFGCILAATCLVLLIAALQNVGNDESLSMAAVLPSGLKLAFESAVIMFMLWVLMAIFKDIANGISPFTSLQAKRLRMAALLQIVHAIFVTLSSPVVLEMMGLHSIAIGAMVGSSSMEGLGRLVPINVGDIVLAIVLFCAALIVEYGSLLQKLSDDTL